MLFCCALSDAEIIDKNEVIENLISRLALGEIDAMDRLYELIKTDVFSFALTKCQNRHDAEDIMHDTFIQIYKYAGRYEPQGKPLAWAFTIITHLAIRYHSLNERTAEADDETFGELSDSTDIELDAVNSQFLKESMQRMLHFRQSLMKLDCWDWM